MPGLIRMRDHQLLEQIRITPVRMVSVGGWFTGYVFLSCFTTARLSAVNAEQALRFF